MNTVNSINQNGCSVCKAGEENYTTFRPVHRPNAVYYQYDYRHKDNLFSCVAPTLEACREKRDKWIQAKNYNQRIELAKANCAFLSKNYSVAICHYDNTALMVTCTEKQLELICRQLHCSGIYSEKSGTGIITNFGQYK